jgi:hypothetical protein
MPARGFLFFLKIKEKSNARPIRKKTETTREM